MRTWAPSLALVSPLAAATIVLAALAIGERTGRPLFAVDAARNSAEAVALGDAAAVVRFLQAGEDPQRVYPLRPEAISSSVLRATTLQAAVLSRRVEMVILLDHAGTLREPALRQELACLAADVNQPGIAVVLVPSGADCMPGAALKRWLDRSRPEE